MLKYLRNLFSTKLKFTNSNLSSKKSSTFPILKNNEVALVFCEVDTGVILYTDFKTYVNQEHA